MRASTLRSTVALVLLPIAVVLLLTQWAGRMRGPTGTIMSGVQAELDLDGLVLQADVVLLIETNGSPVVHWNDASNAPWVATQSERQVPMILTDQPARVLEQKMGSSSTHLVIRTIGGQVGDSICIDEESRTLAPGRTYLVFLAIGDWVGKDVIDRSVYSPVGRTQGVFESLAGRWVSATNLSFTTDDLAAAIAKSAVSH